MWAGHMGEISSWYFLWKSPHCNSHFSREWLQGNAWLTTADVSSTTFLFWDGRLRCFWIRLQSFQKFGLLKGQQRHRTNLKKSLDMCGFLERREKESVSFCWNRPSIWYQHSDIRHFFCLFKLKFGCLQWLAMNMLKYTTGEIYSQPLLETRYKVSHQKSGQSLSWKSQITGRG